MNWLNYHHLYYFWLLSKEGSVTNVATKLSIAQSAVSSQLMQLEDSLGVKLLDRSNKRKTVFTEHGLKVLEYATVIFEAGSELQNWVKSGQARGQEVIRIGTQSGISRNLQFEFLRPLIEKDNIKIETITGDQEKLVKNLSEHQIDVIISANNVANNGKVVFYSHILQKSPFVFVTSKKSAFKNAKLNKALEEGKLYLPSRNFEARPELEEYLDSFRGKYKVYGEIDDIALLRLLALKTNQIVLMPEIGIKNELASGEVIVLSKTSVLQKYYAITRDRKNRFKLWD